MLIPLPYLLFSKYLSFKLSEILIRKIQKLTKFIEQKDNNSLFQLREHLYTFLTLNYRIHECFVEIIFNLIENQYICEKNIHLVLKKFNNFTEKYNNNYRPIYHLESFILFLINLKNKQEKK